MSSADLLGHLFDNDLDIRGRTIYMYGEINEDNVCKWVKGLRFLDKTAGQINVRLNSDGGDTVGGLALYSVIVGLSNHVEMIVDGACMSMAAVILQAADSRKATASAQFMLHIGTSSEETNHVLNVESYVDYYKIKRKEIDTIILNKVRERKPNMTMRKFEQATTIDKYMTAEQAVEWGLIDEVLE